MTKNKRKLIVFICSLVLAMVFVKSVLAVHVRFMADVPKNDAGYLQVYYTQDFNREYSEEHTALIETSQISGEYDFDFYTTGKILRKVRLDVGNIENITLKRGYITIGKIIKIPFFDENHRDRLVYQNNAEVQDVDRGVLISCNESDSYVEIAVGRKAEIESLLVLIFAALIVCALAYFGALIAVREIDKRQMDKRKVIRAVFYIAMAIYLIYINVIVVRGILTRDHEVYSSQTSEVVIRDIDKAGLQEEFVPHGKKLTNLKIQLTEESAKDGQILWNIYDSANKLVYQSKQTDVETVVTEGCLDFNVSGLALQRGETYVIDIQPQNNTKLQVLYNTNGTPRLIQEMEFHYQKTMLLLLAILDLVLFGFLYWAYKKGINNKMLIIFSVITGLFSSILLTPCSMDDEYRHFLRAYDIARGNVRAESMDTYPEGTTGVPPVLKSGGYLVTSVPKDIINLKYMDQNGNLIAPSYHSEINITKCVNEWFYQISQPPSTENEYVSMASTGGITFLSYLPQVIFMLIGRLFHSNGLVLYCLARFGNVAACTFLMWLALKALPEYDKLLWVVYFIPTMTRLRTSCSTDGILYGLVVLLIAYIIRIRLREELFLTPKNLLIILALMVYIALMKLPYALFGGLILMYNVKNYKRTSKRYMITVCNIALTLLLGITTYFFYGKITSWNAARIDQKIEVEQQDEDAGEPQGDAHVQYIRENPKAFATLIANEYITLPRKTAGWMTMYTGFGMWMLLIFVGLVFDERRLRLIERFLLVLISVALWFGILIVFYRLADPAVSSVPYIGARYILPILPAIAFALPNGNKNTQKLFYQYALPFVIMVVGVDLIHLL